MPMTRKAAIQYWSTPVVGVLIGLIYLIGFSIGGNAALMSTRDRASTG